MEHFSELPLSIPIDFTSSYMSIWSKKYGDAEAHSERMIFCPRNRLGTDNSEAHNPLRGKSRISELTSALGSLRSRNNHHRQADLIPQTPTGQYQLVPVQKDCIRTPKKAIRPRVLHLGSERAVFEKECLQSQGWALRVVLLAFKMSIRLL